MDFIQGLVLSQAQLTHQNHTIDPRSVKPGKASASAAALR
jgi:hypothetical protein